MLLTFAVSLSTSSKNSSLTSPLPAPDIFDDAICWATSDLKLSNSFLIVSISDNCSLTSVLDFMSSKLEITLVISSCVASTVCSLVGNALCLTSVNAWVISNGVSLTDVTKLGVTTSSFCISFVFFFIFSMYER